MAGTATKHPATPDGRYVVVRGRLWRTSHPGVAAEAREDLVKRLMTYRRAVATAKKAADPDAEHGAHAAVNEIKIALGERGPVWWDDGAPDYNRRMARNTPYAQWWASHQGSDL